MMKKGLLKKIELLGAVTVMALSVNFVPVRANDNLLVLNSANNQEEMEERPAMIGRLYIPDVGVNVALFDTTGMKYNIGQSYVDAEDSSAWKDKNGIGVVADHGNQTFKDIHKSVSNETMAYIQVGENIKTYVCASSGCGTNTRKKLIDENGQEIYNTKGIDFMTYACADDTGVNIYYQTWTLVPEEEILKEKK